MLPKTISYDYGIAETGKLHRWELELHNAGGTKIDFEIGLDSFFEKNKADFNTIFSEDPEEFYALKNAKEEQVCFC